MWRRKEKRLLGGQRLSGSVPCSWGHWGRRTVTPAPWLCSQKQPDASPFTASEERAPSSRVMSDF